MKVLALDYGAKRIGVAICDETMTLARPLPFIPADSPKKRNQAIMDLVKTHAAQLILIGLPRNMDGSYGESAAAARAFAREVRGVIGLEVKEIDERLTTVSASRLLHEAGRNTRKQKEVIDSMSAVVLLQGWLDSRPL
jgi:putative Holliday junction resolvase